MQALAKKQPFDVVAFREEFPCLQQQIKGKPLVYLDNAASSQTPRTVIEAIEHHYKADRSNIHRGVHTLSQRATKAYEDARLKLQRFVNAADSKEIIFLRGTTEAINLVSQAYGRSRFQEWDEIIISAMEHHSNIVHWQILCEQTGAKLKVIPIDERGVLDLEAYEKMLGPQTKFVSVVYISNALGTINPVKKIIDMAHAYDVPVMLDGAQATPHLKIDVQHLDCDFYTVSGHKMFGPTGVGILYGKAKYLDMMDPYHGGGDMIRKVSFDKTEYAEIPHKFEAGTPNIAGGIGLGAAVDFIEQYGMENLFAYEHELLQYGTELLSQFSSLKMIGTAPEKASILGFTMDIAHPHDIGTILDMEGIAIRAGHHCAQPVMDFFDISATARASLAPYNTKAELDALAKGLEKVIGIFS